MLLHQLRFSLSHCLAGPSVRLWAGPNFSFGPVGIGRFSNERLMLAAGRLKMLEWKMQYGQKCK